jgi:hypothetical protein
MAIVSIAKNAEQPMVAPPIINFKLSRLRSTFCAALASATLAWSIRNAASEMPQSFHIEIEQGCELVVPTRCQGGVRKFNIDEDGVWTIDALAAEPYSGRLAVSERARLRSAVEALQLRTYQTATACAPRPTPPQTPERISISRGTLQTVLHGSAGRIDPLCGRPGSAADEVFSLADSVMRKVLSTRK